jgi:hypothetical protein
MMFEGLREQAWSHTSSIMALIANLHRDPKKSQPFHPHDFNPLKSHRRQPLIKLSMRELFKMMPQLGGVMPTKQQWNNFHNTLISPSLKE